MHFFSGPAEGRLEVVRTPVVDHHVPPTAKGPEREERASTVLERLGSFRCGPKRFFVLSGRQRIPIRAKALQIALGGGEFTLIQAARRRGGLSFLDLIG